MTAPQAVVLSDLFPLLTRREREVCALLARGLQGKEIGAQLGIGHRTVENHREMVFSKLKVRNVVELVNAIHQTPPVVPGGEQR